MSTPTMAVKKAVRRKLYVQEMPFYLRRLQKVEARIFPAFAFIAQIAIRSPFLSFENQLPMIPMSPGQPVA